MRTVHLPAVDQGRSLLVDPVSSCQNLPRRSGLVGLGLEDLLKVRPRLDFMERKLCNAVSPEGFAFCARGLGWLQFLTPSSPTEWLEKLVVAAPWCAVRSLWEMKTPRATGAPLGDP